MLEERTTEMPLYLYLDLGSLLIPLLFSFHPKLRFDRTWKRTLPAILISGFLFIVWDIAFTKAGVWGFNPDYLIGVDLFGLPIEEHLFFICIPYACLFTHHCINLLIPELRIGARATKVVSSILILLLVTLSTYFYDRMYTLVNFSLAAFLLFIGVRFRLVTLDRFFLSYLVILIPFMFVNGLLTGSLIEGEVVWYNDLENMGKRFLTIPFEDFAYAFSMLFLPILIAENLPRGLEDTALS